MIRCDSIVQSRRSISAATSCSIFTGSVDVVHPNRVASRWKWVSMVSPGTPNPSPSTTFAVLRPTPGSETSSAIVPGTSPPNRSTSPWPSPISEVALFRKKPVGRMISSSSARFALA